MKGKILLFGVMAGVACLPVVAMAGIAPEGGIDATTFGNPTYNAGGDWSDGFDTYADGSEIIGQGGWVGWFEDGGAGATVTSERSSGAPHSLRIEGGSDVVQEFGINSGQWTVKGMHYLARNDHTADTYFIMNNEYNGAAGTAQWAIEMQFDVTTGTVIDDFQGGSLPIAYDRWAPIEIIIDLDANTVQTNYDGQFLSAGVWNSQGGAQAIAAIDLFSNGPRSYFDSLSVTPEPTSVLLLVAGAGVALRRRKARA